MPKVARNIYKFAELANSFKARKYCESLQLLLFRNVRKFIRTLWGNPILGLKYSL